MLAVLAADWSLLMFRALFAVLFGIAALILPEPGAAVVFVPYTLLDGIVVLTMAAHLKGLRGFGSVLFEGLVRAAAAFVILAMSLTPSALAAFFAAWAGLTGVGQIATAAVLRREMTGEWPLPIAGMLSLAVAVTLVGIRGVGVRTLEWTIGLYAILFGLAMTVLAVRLRHLALEMAKG